MPKMSDHPSSKITKMLLIGDPGSGKTGALASLAHVGYNVRIIDLDNGSDILANVLKDPKAGYAPEALSRVDYEPITDRMGRSPTNMLVPKTATSWQRAIKLLENWKTESTDYGPVVTWGEKDVLVIDSLTLLSKAAMNNVLSMNGRLGKRPEQSDWYVAQQYVEGLLEMLYDEGVKCNVIVISHITYIGEENGPQHGYPSSLGKSLPPKIGRYFNSMLMMKSSGTGTNVKRKLHTNPITFVELKNSNPTRVKPEYDIKFGLAEFFKDVQGSDS